VAADEDERGRADLTQAGGDVPLLQQFETRLQGLGAVDCLTEDTLSEARVEVVASSDSNVRVQMRLQVVSAVSLFA